MQFYPTDAVTSIPPPSFSARSRRETNTIDTTNARYVEHWQTDTPALMTSFRSSNGGVEYVDTNAIPSRLYREDMRQAQPYVPPSVDSDQVKQELAMDRQVSLTLQSINDLGVQIAATSDPQTRGQLKQQLEIKQNIYKLLLTQRKQLSIDSMGQNPYFEKYDVAGDSRNIVRELRSSVSEDVVDRGTKESQKLLRREMESRWVPANYAESRGIDSLEAYDLMRPRYNQQDKIYRN
jgi:hypothetical protein